MSAQSLLFLAEVWVVRPWAWPTQAVPKPKLCTVASESPKEPIIWVKMNPCGASDEQDSAGTGGMLVLGRDLQGRILGLFCFPFQKHCLHAWVGSGGPSSPRRSEGFFVKPILIFRQACPASALTCVAVSPALIQILPREEVRLFSKQSHYRALIHLELCRPVWPQLIEIRLPLPPECGL